MLESQIIDLLDALDRMQAAGVGAVAPRQELQKAWNAKLQGDLQGTV